MCLIQALLALCSFHLCLKPRLRHECLYCIHKVADCHYDQEHSAEYDLPFRSHANKSSSEQQKSNICLETLQNEKYGTQKPQLAFHTCCFSPNNVHSLGLSQCNTSIQSLTLVSILQKHRHSLQYGPLQEKLHSSLLLRTLGLSFNFPCQADKCHYHGKIVMVYPPWTNIASVHSQYVFPECQTSVQDQKPCLV